MRVLKSNAREIIAVVLVLAVVFGGVQFAMQSFIVQGISMEPSFHDNEYLIVDKLRYRFSAPARGDVIVFQSPQYENELYIKRIVGLPGERVEIREGQLYIEGIQLEEDPDFPPIPNSDTYSLTVPQDNYFVLGDNRRNSTGSHLFGAVPRDNIVGRVWLSYWPLSDLGLSPGYSTDLESIVTASVKSP